MSPGSWNNVKVSVFVFMFRQGSSWLGPLIMFCGFDVFFDQSSIIASPSVLVRAGSHSLLTSSGVSPFFTNTHKVGI